MSGRYPKICAKCDRRPVRVDDRGLKPTGAGLAYRAFASFVESPNRNFPRISEECPGEVQKKT
jgi:hypothetical protein